MRSMEDAITAEEIVLEVANQAGLTVDDLRGDFRRYGKRPTERRINATRARDASIFAMRAERMKVRVIAAALDIAGPTVILCEQRWHRNYEYRRAIEVQAEKAMEPLRGEQKKEGA